MRKRAVPTLMKQGAMHRTVRTPKVADVQVVIADSTRKIKKLALDHDHRGAMMNDAATEIMTNVADPHETPEGDTEGPMTKLRVHVTTMLAKRAALDSTVNGMRKASMFAD